MFYAIGFGRRHIRLITVSVATLVLVWQLYESVWLFQGVGFSSNNDQYSFGDAGINKLLGLSYDFVLSTKKFDERGTFLIVKNISIVWKHFLKFDSKAYSTYLTLVTQCSFNHLHNLLRLREFWNGPISVSVFVPKYRLNVALNMILRLVQCYPSAMHNVEVHLVLPYHNITSSLFVVGQHSTEICSHLRNHFEEIENIFENYQWKGCDYPNNLLRNVAGSSCSTAFKLVLDIDIFPSASLHKAFGKMIERHPLYISQVQKLAYIVPVFETESPEELLSIKSKENLLRSVRLNRTRQFYVAVCAKCQRATNYKKWLELKVSSDLKGAYEIIWEPSYEPFYILPSTAPSYDERFSQYGFNRVSHACELHVSGYRFIVLNSAFLVHDTFKLQTSFHSDKRDDELINGVKYQKFKEDLLQKYSTSAKYC